ncbi:MAG: hypothetical protein ABSF46_30480 [Terriglobia bacterium]|jgi:hypothetical protein
MNLRLWLSFWRTLRLRRLFCFVAIELVSICIATWLVAGGQDLPGLTVHEWGTFTSIAGKNGQAVEWRPLPITGTTDLPGFVEHFDSTNFKLGLRGTIRMETPVMYFYSPQDVKVSVRVAFAKGIITEWYPHALHVKPRGVLRNAALDQLQTNGTIAWENVSISPDLVPDLPREDRKSRYYTARETASSPVSVTTPNGDQQEKFLFYRGVSASPLPLSAELDSDARLWVKNLGQEEIPAIILFERRGEAVGYRSVGAITDDVVLDPPELNDSVESLCAELEGILVERGLYPDEASAMVRTWRDSWFEEGSRLIYIVPAGFVDNILPVAIEPAPAKLVRVFVGRLEIVTPATVRAVKAAVASNDAATLKKYGRFLEPILEVAGVNQSPAVH